MRIKTRPGVGLHYYLFTGTVALATAYCGAKTDLDGHDIGEVAQAITISQTGSTFVQTLTGNCLHTLGNSVFGGVFVGFPTNCANDRATGGGWHLKNVGPGGIGQYTHHQAIVQDAGGGNLCLTVGGVGGVQALIANCMFGSANQTFDVDYDVISNAGRCMRDSGSTDVQGRHIFDFTALSCRNGDISAQITGTGFDAIATTINDEHNIASAWGDNNIGTAINQRELQGATVDGVAQPITTAEVLQVFDLVFQGQNNGVVVGTKGSGCTYASCAKVMSINGAGITLSAYAGTTNQVMYFGRENVFSVGIDGFGYFARDMPGPCVVAPGRQDQPLGLEACGSSGTRGEKLEMMYAANM